MNLAPIAAELLSKRLGLSRELLLDSVIVRALDLALANVQPEERESMAGRLLAEESEEWQRLVDEAVVPETWFYRHVESFQFLARYVSEKWRPADCTTLFRALCIPCASGEEAYSVGMTLLNAGLDASRIRIDAADISARLLARARLGVYGETSFREKHTCFREKYFVNCEQGWRVREDIVRLVRFEKTNLLNLSRFLERAPYDAIFCRNALIYLNESARHEVICRMRELLNADGLLFTGSSELAEFCAGGYVPVDYPQSFACRKAKLDKALAPSRAAIEVARSGQGATTTPHAATPDADRSVDPPAVPGPSTTFEQAERLADEGDLDTAASMCERLLEQNTGDPKVYALLGVISESKGRVEPAEEFFRKALYLAPYHYESLLHMSLLCERRGDVDAAELYRARAGRALN